MIRIPNDALRTHGSKKRRTNPYNVERGVVSINKRTRKKAVKMYDAWILLFLQEVVRKS